MQTSPCVMPLVRASGRVTSSICGRVFVGGRKESNHWPSTLRADALSPRPRSWHKHAAGTLTHCYMGKWPSTIYSLVIRASHIKKNDFLSIRWWRPYCNKFRTRKTILIICWSVFCTSKALDTISLCTSDFMFILAVIQPAIWRVQAYLVVRAQQICLNNIWITRCYNLRQ